MISPIAGSTCRDIRQNLLFYCFGASGDLAHSQDISCGFWDLFLEGQLGLLAS